MDRKQDKLQNILLQDNAININAKVEQTVEYELKKWMTYGNINLWLDTWDKYLVELVFAYRDDEEKIVIPDDKLRRIINLDES